MSQNPIKEMLEFLQPESRIDLKHMALDHLIGISQTEEGVEILVQNEQIINSIIELTNDMIEHTVESALSLLVNISSSSKGATELLKYRPSNHRNILELLINYVLNPQKKNAEGACMTLSNITTHNDLLEICVDTFIPHLNDILNAFVNIDFNKKGSILHYLSPLFNNLSCSHRIREWLTEENPHIPLIKLIPFCNYEQSYIRRGGVIGIVRNLSFDVKYHDFLLSPDLDLLTYLLRPLMGNEDYPDDEMDKLPISLQYLPEEKCRESHEDIRLMILETLNKLCAKRKGREILRENGVYYVLREHHKWEKDPKALLACENVVDILIQNEEEIGVEDLSTVDVPEDMREKFDKMDEDFLKNV